MSDSEPPRKFNACLAKVTNRGIPPVRFLNELIGWAQIADNSIFEVNDKYDVYASVRDELGPWQGITHRKAVMLEVLRVLAGFESSWNWNEGRDTTNPTSNTPETEESGIFQISCNATGFDESLKAYVISVIGARDCRKFIVEMKADHRFAIEFAARLLRFTVEHNGPILHKKVHPWLQREAVVEFLSFLPASS